LKEQFSQLANNFLHLDCVACTSGWQPRRAPTREGCYGGPEAAVLKLYFITSAAALRQRDLNGLFPQQFDLLSLSLHTSVQHKYCAKRIQGGNQPHRAGSETG
jgi:hypothetical protein